MALTLMYITNNPQIAKIAQDAGVDRIWVDLEYIGKDERQAGLDTVKSRHTIEDIRKLRPIVKKSELLVRVNPIHDKTREYASFEDEIEQTVQAGADVIMLPFFKTAEEVERFITCVNGRAKTQLLVETAEAVENLDEILRVDGIDELHIGLNDLHLAYNMKFLFQLLCDGTVASICNKAAQHKLKYGFGGIARIGYGILPAEYVIAEHYHRGSTAAILSRSFCNANKIDDPASIREDFIEGVRKIREREHEVSNFTEEMYNNNLMTINEKVKQILADK